MWSKSNLVLNVRFVARCSRCQANRNVSAHEPLIPTPVPEYPFQKMGTDLFALDGLTYLLTVDYYSVTR